MMCDLATGYINLPYFCRDMSISSCYFSMLSDTFLLQQPATVCYHIYSTVCSLSICFIWLKLTNKISIVVIVSINHKIQASFRIWPFNFMFFLQFIPSDGGQWIFYFVRWYPLNFLVFLTDKKNKLYKFTNKTQVHL